MVPRSALEQEIEQSYITTIALAGVRRIWRRMAGRNWERAWRNDVGPNVQQVVLEAQGAAVASADTYVAAVLSELDIPAEVPTSLNIDALVGVAGDGRSVESLTYGAVIEAAKAQYEPRVASLSSAQAEAAALESAQEWMDEVVATILADSARAAETASTAQRTWVTGYIRMVEPGACSRCVVLAGRFYLFNDGFDRHPSCRCRHIPASEDVADDLRTNPRLYFESLSGPEQDRVFTVAGAEAIRLGADLNQVVNARRGMNTAQQNPRGWIPKGRLQAVKMYGRDVFITTEGVTKSGIYGRGRGNKPVRLMPESILALAESREDALRLLKLYGYVL